MSPSLLSLLSAEALAPSPDTFISSKSFYLLQKLVGKEPESLLIVHGVWGHGHGPSSSGIPQTPRGRWVTPKPKPRRRNWAQCLWEKLHPENMKLYELSPPSTTFPDLQRALLRAQLFVAKFGILESSSRFAKPRWMVLQPPDPTKIQTMSSLARPPVSDARDLHVGKGGTG